LNEIERNLMDAMAVARNILLEPKLVPGGGATEMAIASNLNSRDIGSGVQALIYKSVANCLEVIPRTLAQNCGAKVVKTLTDLRAKHASDPVANYVYGVDGIKGVVADMKAQQVWDSYTVKSQTIKTAIESACLLLRVDDVVSGMKKKQEGGQQPQQPTPDEASEMAE